MLFTAFLIGASGIYADIPVLFIIELLHKDVIPCIMLGFEFFLLFGIRHTFFAVSHLVGVVCAALGAEAAELTLVVSVSFHAAPALTADPFIALAAVYAVLSAVSAAVNVLIALTALLTVIITVLAVFAASAVFAELPAERFRARTAVLAQPFVLLTALRAVLSSVLAGLGLDDALFAELAVIPLTECTLDAKLAGLTPVQIVAEQASHTFGAVVVLVALVAVPAAFTHVLHIIAVEIPDDAVLTFRTDSFRVSAEAVSAEPSPLVDDHIPAAVSASPALHAHGDRFICEAYFKAALAVDGVVQRDRAFQTYLTDVTIADCTVAVLTPVTVLAVLAVIDPLVAFRTDMARMDMQTGSLLKHHDQDQEHCEQSFHKDFFQCISPKQKHGVAAAGP